MTAVSFVQCIRASPHQAAAAIFSSSRGTATRKARFASIVANLGRLDKITPGKLDPLINGLNRAVGRLENTAFELTHDPARAFGDVFALHELWSKLAPRAVWFGWCFAC